MALFSISDRVLSLLSQNLTYNVIFYLIALVRKLAKNRASENGLSPSLLELKLNFDNFLGLERRDSGSSGILPGDGSIELGL